MSEELRIALVAEGPTDYEVIQAALKAVLPKSFVMTLLQPENTQPRLGAGWCGVLKWCQEARQRHSGRLEDDPTLASFYDLIIIHLDVDVAIKKYADCGQSMENWAQANNWKSLPCAKPCPPISDTVDEFTELLKSWLGNLSPGGRALFCLPAQSSGTWLAAAVLPPSHPFLVGGECDPNIEAKLEQLPKAQRIQKSKRAYQAHAPQITEQWDHVKQICSQAAVFEREVLTAVNSL